MYNFKLSSIPNMRRIKKILDNFIIEIDSNKINSLKEEEVKSRFLISFFGDILNFNCGNSDSWMLREEKKSSTDGTKPDAALGYFYINNTIDDVRAVIEIKNANTDLDTKQKRVNSKTPVEQAFEYAPKSSGGNCNWVIVSNLLEIRFYSSKDISKYQVFYLKELGNENKLKELLFLFHKDRLIKNDLKDKSNTDRLLEFVKTDFRTKTSESQSIIDKVFYCLKRFEELGYVNPDYIASIKPFNVLDEYVWHYNDYKLFTINSELYQLISHIKVENGIIIFSDVLSNTFGENVEDAREKLKWSFVFLNKCMITKIQAVKDIQLESDSNRRTLGFSKIHIFRPKQDNHITLDINMKTESGTCDCMVCNYRNFKFDSLLKKLKLAEGNKDNITLKYAFGNFLMATNDYKTSYSILCDLREEAKEQYDTGVGYFLATYNTTLLYNLIQMYRHDDREEIRNNIRALDLDRVLYDELEFYVEKDVLDYLKQIKDDHLIQKTQETVNKLLDQSINLKNLIDSGGSQTGPNYAALLLVNYHKLVLHHYHNSIFYFRFEKYKDITTKAFEALLIGYNTPEHGLLFFTEYILTEAILNIRPNQLQNILKEQKSIRADEESIEIFVNKIINFLTSLTGKKKNTFNEYCENKLVSNNLDNYSFSTLFNSVFSNIFTILCKLEINADQFESVIDPLIQFITIEDNLAWFDLKEFAGFILENGDLFKLEDLENILKITVKKDRMFNVKYEELIKSVPSAIQKFYPDYKFKNIIFIKRAINNCEAEDNDFSNYNKILNLYNICDDACRQILKTTFLNKLDVKFDYEYYELLVGEKIVSIEEGNYFEQYVSEVSNHRIRGPYTYGKLELTDCVFMSFIIIKYDLNINSNRKEFELLTDLNEFENWLLDPYQFDYEKFDPKWIAALQQLPMILNCMGQFRSISDAVDRSLVVDYDPVLAEIKYKYLLPKSI